MEFNLADVFESVAATVPDREAIVWGDLRLTFAELDARANRLANVLHGAGHGARSDRSGLGGHESHQDHLAIHAYNGKRVPRGDARRREGQRGAGESTTDEWSPASSIGRRSTSGNWWATPAARPRAAGGRRGVTRSGVVG